MTTFKEAYEEVEAALEAMMEAMGMGAKPETPSAPTGGEEDENEHVTSETGSPPAATPTTVVQTPFDTFVCTPGPESAFSDPPTIRPFRPTYRLPHPPRLNPAAAHPPFAPSPLALPVRPVALEDPFTDSPASPASPTRSAIDLLSVNLTANESDDDDDYDDDDAAGSAVAHIEGGAGTLAGHGIEGLARVANWHKGLVLPLDDPLDALLETPLGAEAEAAILFEEGREEGGLLGYEV